mgnify:CR=1 FL=1
MDLTTKYDWYTASELANMVAIAESTPGPIGVNMATYAGYNAGFGEFGVVGGILGGITYYPFDKAPKGLFAKALAGGTLGMIYSFTAQTGIGYQIVTKDKFVMSFGADFAFYPSKSDFFWIPSVSAAFGWAF